MEALVGQEAQFVSNPVRKAEPVKSVTHGCSHRCTGRQLKDKPHEVRTAASSSDSSTGQRVGRCSITRNTCNITRNTMQHFTKRATLHVPRPCPLTLTLTPNPNTICNPSCVHTENTHVVITASRV